MDERLQRLIKACTRTILGAMERDGAMPWDAGSYLTALIEDGMEQVPELTGMAWFGLAVAVGHELELAFAVYN